MYENVPQKLKDEALFCVWKPSGTNLCPLISAVALRVQLFQSVHNKVEIISKMNILVHEKYISRSHADKLIEKYNKTIQGGF